MSDIFTILRKRYPESEYALMEEVSDKAVKIADQTLKELEQTKPQ